jgi:hypothetical protein
MNIVKILKAFPFFLLFLGIGFLLIFNDEFLLKESPPKLLGDTQKIESGLGSGFWREGYWRGETVPERYTSLMLVGSYDHVNGYATTGEYVSDWFSGGRFSMLVSGHPKDYGLSLEIETSTGGIIPFAQDNPVGRWVRWTFSVPRDERFRIRALDENSELHGGWLAFSEPFAWSLFSDVHCLLERVLPFRLPLLLFLGLLLLTMLWSAKYCTAENRNLTALAISFAISFLLLAIYGAYLRFSPVPHWDMWDGGVNFLLKLDKGNWATLLWQRHNEHRIVLSRFFFLIDHLFFKGSYVFLIIINFIISLIACVFFIFILRQLKSNYFLILFVISCLFFWSQYENFSSAFQSPFFMAQLLPLLAFYLLYKARTNDSLILFLSACLLGVLSAGTMANGVLALPLMLLYALLVRFEKRWLCVLSFLALLAPVVYFSGFHSNPGHDFPLVELTQRPLELLSYSLTYIGSPFYYIFYNIRSAQATGILLFCCALFMLIRSLLNIHKNRFSLFFLFYLLYLGATALGTAGGRLVLGIQQAVSPRYTTPALMAWMTVLVLYAPQITKLGKKSTLVWVPFCFILFAMLPYQWKATQESDIHFERSVSALALALGVEDESQIRRVYPNMQRPLALAKEAIQQSIGVFGYGDIREIYNAMQEKKRVDCVMELCSGYTKKAELIGEGRDAFTALEGWIETPAPPAGSFLYFLDEDGFIVGACMVEKRRSIFPLQRGDESKRLRFKGYLRRTSALQSIKLFEPREGKCYLGNLSGAWCKN